MIISLRIQSKSTPKFDALRPEVPVNLDADEVLPDDDDDQTEEKRSSDEESNESEEELEEDDDTEALMAELNRIKQERASEAARQEAERKARDEKIRVENILKGNPLLATNTKVVAADEFKVKRRWDDDVVFKNCAKMDDGKKKDYVNDTLRSEFHRKFMDRYVK